MSAICVLQLCRWWRACGVSVWTRIAKCCFACRRAGSISPRALGCWSSLAWGCCWKPQAAVAARMAASRSVGSCWLRRARSMALWYGDQGCLSCSGGIFRGGGKAWSASSGGLGRGLGIVRRRCRGLWPAGPSGSGLYRASARMMVVALPYYTSMREGTAYVW